MPSGQRSRSSPDWAGQAEAELLEWRFADLRLTLNGSPVERNIDELHARLERRGIRFRPHVWLSTDWFSPDGIPGIAVPFFAAHPKLSQLERRMHGEAEGTNDHWRTKILRHEAGHAIDTAYRLRRRSDWRAVFGPASKPYRSDYVARPASRRFVLHLKHWYAQSHPTEDFAETFAVWLQPRKRWRADYADWPALMKLEYVDALMAELAERRPLNSNRSVVASLAHNRRTLREHYRRNPPVTLAEERRYDAWLRRAFVARSRHPRRERLSRFLSRHRPKLRLRVVGDSGTGRYLFEHVADTLCRRARELDLAVAANSRESIRRCAALHERVADDILRRNRERFLL